MIQRRWFFDCVRASLFDGALTQAHVDGLNVLLEAGEQRRMDFRQLAYVLATTYHETARTMQPIAEYGHGAGQPYGVPDPQTGQTYYGRGYVQLTWKANYETMAQICMAPLVDDADLALDPPLACQILFYGMQEGVFTGVCLDDYLNAETTDWVNARRIVNALDRAEEIAGYAEAFHAALSWTPEPQSGGG